MRKKKCKFLLGAGIGLGLGLLFAPKTGEQTRKDLKKKCDELLAKIKETDFDEVKEEFSLKISEIEKSLKELDKEKVLKIAKEKAGLIEEKIEDLVDSAVKTAKPKLEILVLDVKKKTIKAMKQTIKKLEENTKNKS